MSTSTGSMVRIVPTLQGQRTTTVVMWKWSDEGAYGEPVAHLALCRGEG